VTMFSIGLISSIKTFFKFSIGLVDEFVFYIVIFSLVFICYLIIRPFITWFVTLKSIRLLSYIFSSLLILLVILIAKLSIDELNDLLVSLVKISLHCLALFGFSLVIFNVFQRIMKRTE